ncbi:MAG TPA: Ig-like domain-containing protein [Longimicrobium sp.]|jgi:hypothetical protein|uniref:Ig-like domain-containing protein n=1 Tax=Longimicrobium sp. TaxID=2029185 RepID=UPI002EDBB01A
MKRFFFAGLALLLAAAACDSPSGSGPDIASLALTPDDETVTVGDTVRLNAVVRDDEGGAVDAQVQWTSLSPQVASVDGSGLVRALAPGTAKVVAQAEAVADTALITVQSPVPVADCSAANTPQLAVGGSVTLAGAQAATLCLDGAAAGAEYMLMPFFASEDMAAATSVSLQASGNLTAPAGPPSPSLALSRAAASVSAAEGTALDDGGFHQRLNRRAAPHLSTLVPAARSRFAAGSATRRSVQQQTPAVGTLLSLNVGQDFCARPDYRTGRVVAVSQRALVVADTANPVGGFTDADYQNIAATFDTLVYPVESANFGAPADVDANGRSLIFYTRAVNELTPRNAGFIVGGFFYARDLFPRTPTTGFGGACEGSNYAEMFYMLVPDPNGVVNGNRRSTASVRASTVGVLGHEFQHLINASRRLYLVPGVDGTEWDEEAFLNEGLSHIAEELLFYHRAGVGPRSNLGAQVTSDARIAAAFDLFGEENYGRLNEWMRDPGANSTHDAQDNDPSDLATRGAIWSFLRYAADRRNGDDQTLWYNLVNNNRTGFANLRAQLGVEPLDWIRDWAVGAYTDDAVPGIPAILTHPSWNERAVFGALTGSYPLRVETLAAGGSREATLVAGGSRYYRSAVAAGQRGSVLVRSGPSLPSAAVSVTVVRTR